MEAVFRFGGEVAEAVGGWRLFEIGPHGKVFTELKPIAFANAK